mmetsp:Transcript_32455/g.94043  ORF Transcript_32455/g.94043 Transcript_32455/m.94043 type:complete len:233 (+) Transcript_32455:451-1149(+)
MVGVMVSDRCPPQPLKLQEEQVKGGPIQPAVVQCILCHSGRSVQVKHGKVWTDNERRENKGNGSLEPGVNTIDVDRADWGGRGEAVVEGVKPFPEVRHLVLHPVPPVETKVSDQLHEDEVEGCLGQGGECRGGAARRHHPVETNYDRNGPKPCLRAEEDIERLAKLVPPGVRLLGLASGLRTPPGPFPVDLVRLRPGRPEVPLESQGHRPETEVHRRERAHSPAQDWARAPC